MNIKKNKMISNNPIKKINVNRLLHALYQHSILKYSRIWLDKKNKKNIQFRLLIFHYITKSVLF